MADQDAILAAIMQQMSIKTGPAHPPPRAGPVHPVSPPASKHSGPPKHPPEYHTTGPIFTPREENSIGELLRSPQTRFEIEASLGVFKGSGPRKSFHPGLKSLYCFNQLKEALERLSRSRGGTMDMRSYYDLVERVDGVHTRKITDLETGGVTYQKKYRNQKYFIDNTKFGIRVSKSSEEHTDTHDFERDWEDRVDRTIDDWRRHPPAKGVKPREVAVQRFRRRISFTEISRGGYLFGLRFDLTSVEEIHIREDGSTWQTHKYEVEVERIEQSVDVATFVGAVEFVLGLSQNNLCPEQLLDLRERTLAVQLHNNIFFADMLARRWKPKDPYRLFSGYWNKPKNVKIKDMLDPRFDPAVTIKLNGRRNTVLIDKNGVYMYSPPYDVFKIGDGDEELSGTVIDAEFILVREGERIVIKSVYGFDLLFYKDRDLRQDNFHTRLDLLTRVADEWDKRLYCGIQYQTKKYFQSGSFYDRTRAAFAEIDSDEKYHDYNLQDGLIFQPDHWYKNNHTFKWKPEEDLTIDFKLEKVSVDDVVRLHQDMQSAPRGFPWMEDFRQTQPRDVIDVYLGRVFWILVGAKGKDVSFAGTRSYPFPGYIIVENDEYDGQTIDKKIIECSWDYEAESFRFYRVRDDRDRPNNLETARSVWEDIMNPIPQATIEGKTLQLMRKYHNQEKLALLTKEFGKGAHIIDIGSGRGGDLRKWDSVGFGHVLAVEPNQDNVNEFIRRKREGDYSTEVTMLDGYGAERTDIIQQNIDRHMGGRLDGIVSFFSLTFFPEKREMYDALLETIDLLPEGGKFIGAVMDGYKVRDLLDRARHEQKLDPEDPVDYYSGVVEEDSAFTIKQITEFDDVIGDDVIGNEIEVDIRSSSSMVTEQTEWLFYFEPFKRALEKRGFKLISQGFLDKGTMYDKLPEQAKAFSKLNRAFVFEKKRASPPKAPKIKDLQSDEMDKLPNPYSEKLYYVGTQLDESNFIHAILRAISPEYFHMDTDERARYALKIRRVLARKLTKELFEELHRGELARRLQHPYLEEYDEEEASEIAFLEFKLKLMGGDSPVGEVSMLEVASKVLGIDIYVLDGPDAEPSKRFAEECGKLYVHDKSVVLYTIDGIRYHLVAHRKGKEYYYLFDSSSKLIQTLHQKVCGE